MRKMNKQIIVSCSLTMLVLGVGAPNTLSLSDTVAPTASSESVPSKEFNEQSPSLSQAAPSSEISKLNIVEATNEGLDSWMPNSELQNFVSAKLGIDKSEITKELLANSGLSVNYDQDRAFFYLASYEGLQFFSSVSAYVSASSEDSSLSYLRANPIVWENLGAISNLSIGVDGDLTAIFPNGIDLNDNRIHIDPHNVYFVSEVKLNQNNFNSFFLSYSDLKLLNVDPSIFYYIGDLSFAGESYKVTPQPNGLQFDLTNNVDYSLLAGKNYVNTNAYPNFPDGPYVQFSLQNKYINSRINLYFAQSGADVTVRYIDQDSKEISPSKILTGGVGENYTSDQLIISGYTFKEVSGNARGIFTDQPQTVTYIYTKDVAQGADVTAKYVDTDGKRISDDVVKNGKLGENYSTEQKAIGGYTFKEVQGNATGQFTDQSQTVIYVYVKDVEPVLVGADILVKYVDTDGKRISDDVVKTGKLGENYSTEQKAIGGYTFKEVQGNATGQFTDQFQTVTYVYTKNSAKVADGIGHIITNEWQVENPVNSEYKTIVSNNSLKVESKITSKFNIKKRSSVLLREYALPKTSENKRMTLLSIILGFFLLLIGMIVTLFRGTIRNK